MRGSTLVGVIATLWTLCVLVHGRCERTPEGVLTPKSVSDGRFKIMISGDRETYVPGEQYTVFLRGTVNAVEQHKFKEFLLVVEERNLFRSNIHRKSSVGRFSLYADTLTRFSVQCPDTVTQTNSLPKSEIQVIWEAPPAGSGCVELKATVVQQKNLWFMDDGDLTKVLCEDVADTEDTQPHVLEKCCACDEAKYEVTFEGLWSRNTHPKDFPSNGWLTRFSDVIGASHSRQYTFWSYGEIASEGLKQVASDGNTLMLESELKAKSDQIRTIIKAKGISFPNVTGRTFAVFRVDKSHHLISLVSMIDPSPDWFVGVSSLELCLRNCSWIESKVLNLYPWDAGTDDGWTYISPSQPSNPRHPIRRIKSNSPSDPRSPFFDKDGDEMKPFARLYLVRQRLYEKSCSSNQESDEPGGSDSYHQEDDCEVTEWSQWSPCTSTCGRGSRYRQRTYVNEASAAVCKVHLTSRANCVAPMIHCPDPNMSKDPMCALSDWSEWSSCTVTCGYGVKTRIRRYLTRNATKHCVARTKKEHLVPLQQTEGCIGIYGSCHSETLQPGEELIPRECITRPWSEWSPCSATCGRGYQARTRAPVADYMEDADDFNHEDNGDDESEEEEDPCEDERVKEVVTCTAEIPSCDMPATSTEITTEGLGGMRSGSQILNTLPTPNGEPPLFIEGPTGPVEDCKVSKWSKWSHCNATACHKGYRRKFRHIVTHTMNGGKPCPKKLMKLKKCRVDCDGGDRGRDRERDKDNLVPSWGNSQLGSTDCVMSKWTPWSPCSHTCGSYSVKQRTRRVLIPATRGGLPCLHRVETKPCNMLAC